MVCRVCLCQITEADPDVDSGSWTLVSLMKVTFTGTFSVELWEVQKGSREPVNFEN